MVSILWAMSNCQKKTRTTKIKHEKKREPRANQPILKLSGPGCQQDHAPAEPQRRAGARSGAKN